MTELGLNSSEQKTLTVFSGNKPLTEATIKRKIGDLSPLDALRAKKLVERIEPTGRARSVKWALTELGLQVQKKIKDMQPKKKAVKKKKAPKRKGGITKAATPLLTMEDVLQAVTNYCTPYFERYNRLLDELTEKVNYLYSQSKIKKPSIELGQFQKVMKEIYTQLNLKNNYGDVVPLPILKHMLMEKIPGLSSKDMNAYLMKLEEKRVIDLQIASDPSKVPDAQEGILHPSRGLIYYVTWRH